MSSIYCQLRRKPIKTSFIMLIEFIVIILGTLRKSFILIVMSLSFINEFCTNKSDNNLKKIKLKISRDL